MPKPRHADLLKEMGCEADLETFRCVLIETKTELFPDMSIEELCFTRDEAAEFCQAVRKKLSSPKLTRVFLLRALTGIRKNRPKP